MVPLVVLTLFSLLSTTCSTSLVNDFHVLVKLKKGFQFPEPLLSSWISSNPSSVCSWAGIECAWGRVVSLNLTDMNMCGSVSPQISRLDRLTNLSLAGNNFTGSIEMANLSDLRFLNISNNQFNGHLDWKYASISNLEVLDAYNNNFTALLPLGIVGLKRLKYLDLGGNYFYGKIPPSYGTLVGLEYLSLAGNDLEGKIPGELGKLIKLREIYLGYYNVFEGSIPLELGNLVNLVHMDLSSCELDGPIPQELGNLQLLDTLYLHLNQLSGPIPKQLGNLTNLVNLDLSHNALTGEIPSELVNLKQLRLFNLFMNRLHGSIPDYVADLPNLETLGLWMNNFTGVIPENLGQNGKLQLLDLSSNKLTGNPRLCGSLLKNPCNFSAITRTPRKAPRNFKLIFTLGLLICSLIFATAAIIKAKPFKKNGTDSWKMTTFQKLEFTAADILECIKDGNVIGRGGAGIVYHGKMPNGTEIAVKKLLGFGTSNHDHGFRAEIQTLGNIRHRNIVRLLAFCSNKETNLLVYEYMSNGSLGEVLHGKKGAFLGWNLRCKIAAEAAKGLCYLHHDCSPLIVHRDVKSNNILLNSTFEAHVADFGLAKFLIDGAASECMSAIAGSYGYIAPEYAYTLRVDEKSDVYSFGVVLLELITGRRPVGGFSEGVDIVQWVKGVTKCRREVIGIVDPRLTSVPKDEAILLLFIAMLCVQENSIERPTMREVVQMLSEFPRHSLKYQSSSSFIQYQQKNLEENQKS
ncbi:hypothetical protein E1A91_A12G046200v1 [Gossypium mustelinum]|uniref:non-specific serine/threonine protein kinase n=1 Tax=Gossypium mustelinum TaxID=34275 RepID=A0A5D2WQB1_GOSMU|nr:hypothetical protein E1A91_A12G046200v1 [Gossypium mustelinum]